MANGPFSQELSQVNLSDASFTTPGVRDDTRLQRAQLIAQTASSAGQAVAVNQLTGEQRSASLVEADPSLVDSPEARQAIDDLTKLTAARRAGLGISETRARAGSIVRQAKSSLVGAFFTDEIDAAAKDFFGGGQLGSGGIFEMTPAEKAQADYEGLIAQTALEFGVSPTAAQNIINHQRAQAVRTADMEEKLKNQKFTEQDFAAYTTQTVEQFSQQIMGTFFRGGDLNPEQLNALQADIPRFASQLKQRITQAARGPDGRALVSQAALNTELAKVDKMVETLTGMSNNKSLLDITKQNKELMSNNIDIFTMQNFADWQVIQRAGGDEGMRWFFENARGNKVYDVWAQSNNPILARMGGLYNTGQMNPLNIISGGMAALSSGQGGAPGGKLTDEQVAGATEYLTGKGSSKSFLEMLSKDEGAVLQRSREMYEKVPQSIVHLATPEWQARHTENPAQMEKVIQNALVGVQTAANLQRFVDGGARAAPGPISITPVALTAIQRDQQSQGSFLPGGTAGVRRALGAATGEVNVTGDNVSASVRGNVRDMLKVARAYPTLWEGNYESAEDFVINLMDKGPDAFRDAGETQPGKVPEVSQGLGTGIDPEVLNRTPIDNPIGTKHHFAGRDAVNKVEEIYGPLTPEMERVVELEGFVDVPYKDTKGITTFGVGQTGEFIEAGFPAAFEAHVDRARSRIPELDNLPTALRAELIQAEYRGDLGLSPATVRLINQGRYLEASQEFLNNREYESASTPRAIKRRMEDVADALANQAVASNGNDGVVRG